MRLSPAIAVLAVTLAGCQGGQSEQAYQGYIEGEYILIAPEEAGRIEALFVQRGEEVSAGAPLFAMQSGDLQAERAEAAARLAQAEAELDDLLSSQRRPEEIAVIEANIQEAEATLVEAGLDLDRQQKLVERDFASQSTRDSALAARNRAQARLAALQHELEVAHLPGRSSRVIAAERHVEAAQAALDHVEWRLAQTTVSAPAAGLVEEVVRRTGEAASANAPVISLLPPENRKVRFFVPEQQRSALSPGMEVAIACDGCPTDLSGKISFIASDAEFTPPVIFSVESRDKLVYMVEARLTGAATTLMPGQPVDISMLGTGG
ncbi:MAG: HlyD family efflux transporter periplasmic adaptor subunit [Pseudomonadota bacterium]